MKRLIPARVGHGVACGGEVKCMRIGINAHLLSTQGGYRQAGVSRYIEALLNELPRVAEANDEIVAYTSSLVDSTRTTQTGLHLKRSVLPTESPPVRILWEQTAGALAGLADRLDLFHAPVNVSPIVSTAPAVVTVHDLAFERYPEHYPPPRRQYLSRMTQLSVRTARRVIAVSEATRDDLVQIYGLERDRIRVVPNGVDERMQRAGDEQIAEFRTTYDLPERFLLFVGTLQPRKNLEGLIRAMGLLRRQIDWPLIVGGGQGWMYDTIQREALQQNVVDRVRFVGYLPAEELPLWYSAASIVVVPSFYEGFGLPALEAMACGTPVVAANTSSLPEVVGDAGILVDPRRPQKIAAGILELAGDDARREELGVRARERAIQYCWRRTARETYAVYRTALAGI